MAAVVTVAYWLQFDWLVPVTMLPAWIWLIPIALTLLVFFKTNDVLWRAFFLISLTFVAFFVEEARSVPRQVFTQQSVTRMTDVDQTDLRVISFNAAGASDTRLQEILDYDADLILLQESPGKDAVATLTRQAFGKRGSFVWNQDTSILFRGQMKAISQTLGKHFVSAEVEHLDRSIHVVSLRLSPPVSNLEFWTAEFWRRHRDTRILHRKQIREIASELSPLNAPTIIVGGDFNSVPGDGAMLSLEQLRLRDSFVVAGLGYGATGTNQWPLFRVDQVWSNAKLTPIATTSRKSKCSDHRIVVADFSLSE